MTNDILTPDEVDAIEVQKVKASQEISRICEGGRWKMCIPVELDTDSDIIFSDLTTGARSLIASHRAQAARIKELAKENRDWRDHASTPQKVAKCGKCGEDITNLTVHMAMGVLICADCVPPEEF